MNSTNDERLRRIFDRMKEIQYEKEINGELDTDYMDLNIDALELMGELADTLNEKQLDLFRKINELTLEYQDECEFIAFKNGFKLARKKFNKGLK